MHDYIRRKGLLHFMAKNLRPKHGFSGDQNDFSNNLNNSGNKNGFKNLDSKNLTKSSPNSNHLMRSNDSDGPPQLNDSQFDNQNKSVDDVNGEDSSIYDSDGGYYDGFTDDASGWMADKMEDGLKSAKSSLTSSGSTDTKAGTSELKADGETSDSDSNVDLSEQGGNDNSDASVDGQNSSGNGDALGINVDNSDDEDDGDSETTMDKMKGAAKSVLMANGAVQAVTQAVVQSVNALAVALTAIGVPAAGAVATGLLTTIVLAFVSLVGVFGAAIVNDQHTKDERIVHVEDCGDKEKAAEAAVEGAGSEGLTSAEQEENVKKIHSALHEWGLTDIQVSGVVGNGDQESNLNPKKFESDYVAGGKYKTEENYERARKEGPLIESIFGSWSTFISYYSNPRDLNEKGYAENAPAGKHTLGVGVWQWTGLGAMGLWNFSKDKSLDMWSMDTQLKFMLSSFSDKSSYYHRLEKYKSLNSSNPEQAAADFLDYWEYEAGAPRNDTVNLPSRSHNAAKWYVKIKEMQVDKDYAKSILDAVVKESASASESKIESTSEALHDCQNETTGYGGTGWQKKGGSYSGSGSKWKYNELPDELKQYAIDPRSLGMKYGSREGWTLGGDGYVNSGYCNQCTSLSSSLMGVLWEKDGEPLASKHGMHGNGNQIVGSMSSHMGTKVRKEPVSGDVFSSHPNDKWGHTGVVSHVFENGDMLVIEQNIKGVSGAWRTQANPGILGINEFEWSYRYIKKGELSADGYTFTSPESKGYKISSKAKSVK